MNDTIDAVILKQLGRYPPSQELRALLAGLRELGMGPVGAAPTFTTVPPSMAPFAELMAPPTFMTPIGNFVGTGKWIRNYYFAHEGPTSLESLDLAGTVEWLEVDDSTTLETISFPALLGAGSGVACSNLSALESFDAPLLRAAGTIAFGGCAALATINVPALEVVGDDLQLSGLGSLVTLSLPSIIAINRIHDAGAGGIGTLENLTLGATLKEFGSGIDLSMTSLSEASVDGLLVRLAALDGTNGTTSYDDKVVDLGGFCVAPSATGLAAKVVLEARGCTVTVTP